jgi:TonB family protein
MRRPISGILGAAACSPGAVGTSQTITKRLLALFACVACASCAASPSRRGSLIPPEAIRAVVLEHMAEVRACYESGLEIRARAEDRVLIRFVIGPRGSVLAADVASESAPIPTVGQCLAAVVRRWTFPAPRGHGVVTVRCPFRLMPAERR